MLLSQKLISGRSASKLTRVALDKHQKPHVPPTSMIPATGTPYGHLPAEEARVSGREVSKWKPHSFKPNLGANITWFLLLPMF